MAINIPQQTTLMDHLASVGRRYVQNKADADRLRMAQEFQMARDAQSQAFQTGIATEQNELARDQIRLTGEQNRILQLGRYTGEGELLEKTIMGTLAEARLRSEDSRYGINAQERIAKAGFGNRLDIANVNRYMGQDAIAGNKAVEDLRSATQIELYGIRSELEKTLQREGHNADIVKTMNMLDAELQWRREQGASNERIAGIGADVQLDTNATNQAINADRNLSNEIIASITEGGATDRTRIADTGETKRTKLNNDMQRFGIKKAAEMERMRLDSAFETLETTLDWQGKQNAPAIERQLIENRIIEYQFSEAQKNQYVRALDNIAPILELKGITKEQYLADPETYSEILSKAVDRNNAFEIVGSAFGFSPGYETNQEKKKTVDDALQSLLFLNALSGNPAQAGTNGLSNIVNNR